MTLADNSYMGLAGVEFYDFANKKQLDFRNVSIFPMGKMNLPNDSKIGEEGYDLTNMLGVLDWGRGAWTYNNTWYWSSASGRLENGTLFGFNLGYGFGDRSSATENMIFYNGKAYKLNDVDFGVPNSSYMDPWHFTSRDKAINMTFQPMHHKDVDINLGVFRHNPNQVFGLFSGYIEIDSGERIKIKEIFGFAEKIHNKW